jgi:hypothetical protein
MVCYGLRAARVPYICWHAALDLHAPTIAGHDVLVAILSDGVTLHIYIVLNKLRY